MTNRYDLLLVTGPTATGKTALAAAVARRLGGEVISADSRQVYRGMDIGTGKDYDDYIVDEVKVPFHLIDIADPGYKYNVFEYQKDFLKVYSDLKQRMKFPVVCGGSGMYADSIISGYRMYEVPPDEELRSRLESKSLAELKTILSEYKELHNVTDIDNKKRAVRAIEIEEHRKRLGTDSTSFPAIKSLVVGVAFDRETRRRRITNRLIDRLNSGLIEEVKGLIEHGVSTDMLIYYGLEYKYIALYLSGKISYEEMTRDLEIAIHQFAKRQMTWFRGMERKGVKIHWLDGNLSMNEKIKQITDLLDF